MLIRLVCLFMVRMLGSAADAEDVIQESWLRWADADRLPEPLLTSPDVAEDVELAESVSIAMLTVLETLGPVERAVFVLRGVFEVPYDEIAAADRTVAGVDGGLGAGCDPDRRRGRAHVHRAGPVHGAELVATVQLSGGQQNMLAMARSLMVDPAVVVLDEPTAGLSPAYTSIVWDQIERITASGTAAVVVEQNVDRAIAHAARVYVLVAGANYIDGPAAEIAALDLGAIFLGHGIDHSLAPADVTTPHENSRRTKESQ